MARLICTAVQYMATEPVQLTPAQVAAWRDHVWAEYPDGNSRPVQVPYPPSSRSPHCQLALQLEHSVAAYGCAVTADGAAQPLNGRSVALLPKGEDDAGVIGSSEGGGGWGQAVASLLTIVVVSVGCCGAGAAAGGFGHRRAAGRRQRRAGSGGGAELEQLKAEQDEEQAGLVGTVASDE